jgi:hypothetical protein
MKTTIELPDQLMTEVKVLAARERRKLGELMAELVRAGLKSRPSQPMNNDAQRRAAERWTEEWIRLGEKTLRDSPSALTATEILTQDRNRLERR